MSSPERSAEEGHAGTAVHDSSHDDDKKRTRLYEILGLEKKCTEDEIKKAYRRMALRYHPDKNLDGDPEKTEKFKEINYANTILSNPTKRKVYDDMGETGLKLMEQFGDDDRVLRMMLNPWMKWLFYGIGLLTCGFCCCCCGCMCCFKCCCNFCCGKFKPKIPEEFDDFSGEDSPPVVVQPGAPTHGDDVLIPAAAPASDRPAVVIAMPAPAASNEPPPAYSEK